MDCQTGARLLMVAVSTRGQPRLGRNPRIQAHIRHAAAAQIARLVAQGATGRSRRRAGLAWDPGHHDLSWGRCASKRGCTGDGCSADNGCERNDGLNTSLSIADEHLAV